MAEGRVTIGNVRIAGLTDATVNSPMPLDRLYPDVPIDAWAPYYERYPSAFGSPTTWHNHFGSYLVRSEGKNIIVDTGVGPAEAPLAKFLQKPGLLMQELAGEGVSPEEIDIVVLTHLHADHVGWNVIEEDGKPRLTFPNARYVVPRIDWEQFHQAELPEYASRGPGYPSRETYVAACITPLESLGALDLTEGDAEITSELRLLHTPGHSAGHQSILVASGDERAIITGDVLLHPAQVTEPDWTPLYDQNGETARATRRSILDRIEAEGMIAAACHFPEPGFGRIIRLEGRRYWQAL